MKVRSGKSRAGRCRSLGRVDSTMHRITGAEYRALAEAGFFDERRVELLEGVIVDVAAMGRPLLLAVQWLNRRLVRGVGDDLLIQPSGPVVAGPISEPEPGLVVVRVDWAVTEPDGDPPRSPLLVIEVVHSSLRRDLLVKPPIHAAAGHGEYRVVDLHGRRVAVYTRSR